MDLQLNIDEAKPGMDVWFFVRPKDSVPTMRTTITAIDYDERGRPVVLAKGVDEWLAPFYFRQAPERIEPKVKYSFSVPFDDLYARTAM